MKLHYTSLCWDRHLLFLETTAFPECHIGAVIAEELKWTVQRYVTQQQVSAVVHDQEVIMELCHAILFEDEGWERLHCSAHCLQLCLKEGLRILAKADRLLGAVCRLAGHFSQCGGYW